jgi:hypothetical protein
MQGLKISEHQIQNTILELLKWRQLFYWRNNTGAVARSYTNKAGQTSHSFVRFGQKGLPDILVVMPTGKLLGIEVKSATGKPSPDQLACQQVFRETNAEYLIVRSSEEVNDYLNHQLDA